ncbi:DUF4331 domain-containing protein [Actinoplanes sp. CA-131856]
MIKRSLAATGAAVLVVSLTALGPGASTASSHREAPLIASDPAADNTDLYAFVSPDRPGYVTMIANWIPFEEPDGGPNFYPFATDAAYRINVDSDGDAKPDAIFRWTFKNVDKRGNNTFLYNNGPVTSLDDKNLLFKQTYTLESSFNGEPFKTRITDAPVAPSRIGAASMPDYQKLRDQSTVQLKGGWKLFAGQADDPFFLDLEVFDLLYGGDLSERGNDTLAGYNVNSLAIQVPFKDVALKGDAKRNPVIGVWTTTERNRYRMASGDTSVGSDRVQVSRLGNPLVNEVVVPAGLKDAFNSISPDKDAGIPQVVKRVTDPELPKLIEGIYKVKAPPTPRNDLVEIYLTGITTKAGGPIKADLNSQLNNMDVNAKKFRPSEMLRLNLGVPVSTQPERLGVLAKDLQGFPNGRRLTDDVLDISLQAVEGAAQSGKLVDALADGDKVDANDNAFGTTFPYLALPNQGAVNADRKSAPAAAPSANETEEPAANETEEPAPDITPAAASSGLSNSSAVLGGVLGAIALVTMLTVWWLMRRRRLARPSSNDDTVMF